MDGSHIERNSAEYAEMVVEFFVETVRKAATKAMCCEYRGEDITPSLMEALHFLYNHWPSPVRNIAAALEVSLSAASQLVERLVKKDLVTRTESLVDRRVSKVALTESGTEIVRQMRERRSKWFNDIVDSMPDSKRSAFLEGLEGFLQVSLADEENLDRTCDKCGVQHVPFCVISKIKVERAESKRL